MRRKQLAAGLLLALLLASPAYAAGETDLTQTPPDAAPPLDGYQDITQAPPDVAPPLDGYQDLTQAAPDAAPPLDGYQDITQTPPDVAPPPDEDQDAGQDAAGIPADGEVPAPSAPDEAPDEDPWFPAYDPAYDPSYEDGAVPGGWEEDWYGAQPLAEEPETRPAELIRVAVPAGDQVVVNPYRLSLPGSDGRETQEQIVHTALPLTNLGDVPVQVNVSARGTTTGEAVFTDTPPGETGWEKLVFLYAEFQPQPGGWSGWYSGASNQLLITDRDSGKDGVMALEAGGTGYYRLFGAASVPTETMWTADDTVSLKLVFTFTSLAEPAEPLLWDDPAAPEENPVIPEENPVIPEETPVIPEENPVIPEENPVIPEEDPVIPEENPVVPEENPVIPEETPVIPEENPVVPEEDPVVPEENPVDPEETPVVNE